MPWRLQDVSVICVRTATGVRRASERVNNPSAIQRSFLPKWGAQILLHAGLDGTNGDDDTMAEALREAFHAVLTGGVK